MGSAGVLLCISLALACASASVFPRGFMWGTATSSYQIEGAWNVSGSLSRGELDSNTAFSRSRIFKNSRIVRFSEIFRNQFLPTRLSTLEPSFRSNISNCGVLAIQEEDYLFGIHSLSSRAEKSLRTRLETLPMTAITNFLRMLLS